MWTSFIVKRDITSERDGQIAHTSIPETMSFLHLQVRKEGFHWSVIISHKEHLAQICLVIYIFA